LTGTVNAVKAIRMEEPAADHLATIDWQRGAWSDKKGKYSRQHLWVLAGTKLKASESGAVLPAAYRDNTPIDPQNMFVATIASAHMLTWLHIAFGMEIEVESYVDRAYGVLTALEGGDCWISEVILHPKITLKAGYELTAEAMAHLHEHAQEHCYIARSIKTKVTVRSV
jgi:organic hydroperoxide reductase OsmC/OhrA